MPQVRVLRECGRTQYIKHKLQPFFFGELNVDRACPPPGVSILKEQASDDFSSRNRARARHGIRPQRRHTVKQDFQDRSLGNWILWLHSLHHSARTAAARQSTSAVKNRWRSHFVLSTSNQLPYAGMTAN